MPRNRARNEAAGMVRAEGPPGYLWPEYNGPDRIRVPDAILSWLDSSLQGDNSGDNSDSQQAPNEK